MTSSPRQRLLAALIDVGLMLVWAAVVGLCVLFAALAGSPYGWGLLSYNLLWMALVIGPVTVALSALEAGRYEATPGKLWVGLRVRLEATGARIGWGRSLVRNLLKLGLPWALIHLALLALFTAPTVDGAGGALLAVGVPCAYLVSLFAGSGRTLYDALVGTTVISVRPARRVAEGVPLPADE